MEFFVISLRAAEGIGIIALLSNLVLCYAKKGSKLEQTTYEIVKQCRWPAFIYFILAWFMADIDVIFASGRTAYGEIANIMLTKGEQWLFLFFNTLICKLWSNGDKMSKEALQNALLYLILGYLIQ